MDKTTYQETRQQALNNGDTNFCVPMALSLVSGKPFNDVNNILLTEGIRRKRSGVSRTAYMSRLETHFGITAVNVTSQVRAAGGKTIRTVARVLPKGRFLVGVRGHVVAVINGEVCDWTDNRMHRVLEVFEVIAVDGELLGTPKVAPVYDIPAPQPKPAPTPTPAPIVQPTPVVEPTQPAANVVLKERLHDEFGFNTLELGFAGKYVKWNTTNGVLYMSRAHGGKTRIFIRNPETLAAVEDTMERVTAIAGNRTAKYTAWTLNDMELEILHTQLGW